MIPVIWPLVLSLVLVLADGWLTRSGNRSKLAEHGYRAMVRLHGIQRQREVAQFKVELRRDAAAQRRRLDAELREQDKRERGQ